LWSPRPVPVRSLVPPLTSLVPFPVLFLCFCAHPFFASTGPPFRLMFDVNIFLLISPPPFIISPYPNLFFVSRSSEDFFVLFISTHVISPSRVAAQGLLCPPFLHPGLFTIPPFVPRYDAGPSLVFRLSLATPFRNLSCSRSYFPCFFSCSVPFQFHLVADPKVFPGDFNPPPCRAFSVSSVPSSVPEHHVSSALHSTG